MENNENIESLAIAEGNKNKVATVVNKVMTVVVSVVIFLMAGVFIGNEAGWEPCVRFCAWLNENWGVAVGSGSIAVLVAIGKYLTSIGKSQSDAEALILQQNALLAKQNKKVDGAVEEIKTLESSIQVMQTAQSESLAQAIVKLENQPEIVAEIDKTANQTNEMMDVLFRTFKVFVQKATNEVEVLNLLNTFEQSTLFAKAKAMVAKTPTEAENSVPPAIIEKVKEVVPQVVKAAKKAYKGYKELKDEQ